MKYFSIISKNKKLNITVFALFLTFIGTTQVSGISPYSRLGLGDFNNQNSASSLSYGGDNVALSDFSQINLSNPATFSGFSKHLPVFELDFASQFITLKTSNNTSNVNGTKFSKMALALPVNKNLGFALGLLPYSTTNYNVISETTNTTIGKTNYLYQGNGGLNRAFLGTGYKLINKDSIQLSFGINTSLLFGNIEKSKRVEFPEDDVALNSLISQRTHINGFNFNIGLHYKQILKRNVILSLGGTISTASNLNARREEFKATYTNTFGVEKIRDTLDYSSKNEGKIKIPLSMTFGIALNINKNLDIFAQYKSQDWGNYKETFSTATSQDSLSNSSTISGGLRYTPSNIYDKNPYYQEIQYKIGFRYSQTAINFNNTQINEFGTSFGLGLPIRVSSSSKNFFKSVSMINIGAEFGTRGTTDNGLIKENFTNIYVGISIMPLSKNKWFVKRKIN